MPEDREVRPTGRGDRATTWFGLVCPGCGGRPLDEDLATAILHPHTCGRASDDELYVSIIAALMERDGRDAVSRAMLAAGEPRKAA